VAAALRERLRAVVGAEHVEDGDPVDGVMPSLVARPAGVEEVSRLLALAHAEGLAVLPRGSGSALDLGNPPARADLVLDLARLDRVLEYEPADVTVTVEAGMTLDGLDQILAKHHQFLPLDPPGWRSRTIGGALATNASGPLRARYGTGRDLLLGVRFVQADGTVTSGGSKVVKSVTGYDVPKLLVGSLGTLGVIVETTLRLHPTPEFERSWLCSFPSLDLVRRFLAALLDSTLQPGRVEILNEGALRAAGQPGAPGAVAVSIASVEEAVGTQGAALLALCADARSTARSVGSDFWDIHGAALARTSAWSVRLRIACLAASVTGVIALVERLASEHGLRARVGGCAAAGALGAVIDGECPADVWDSGVLAPLRQRLHAEGGSAVVERCPRPLKERLDVWGPLAPEALAVMTRLKTEFDPTGVLNPGRFVGRL